MLSSLVSIPALADELPRVEIIRRYPVPANFPGAVAQSRDGRFGSIDRLTASRFQLNSTSTTGARRPLSRFQPLDVPLRQRGELVAFSRGGWIAPFDQGIFTVDEEGVGNVWHFDRQKGFPYGPLIGGPDGQYYGLTFRRDGQTRQFFRISADGVFTSLHEFVPPIQTFPYSLTDAVRVGSLLLADDGDFRAVKDERIAVPNESYTTHPSARLMRISKDGVVSIGAPNEHIGAFGLCQLPDGRFACLTRQHLRYNYSDVLAVSVFGSDGVLQKLVDSTTTLPQGNLTLAGALPKAGQMVLLTDIWTNPGVPVVFVSPTGEVNRLEVLDRGQRVTISSLSPPAHDGHMYGFGYRLKASGVRDRLVFLRVVDPQAERRNLQPIARDDNAAVPRTVQQGALVFDLKPLVNDSDGDGDALTITRAEVDAPASCTVAPDGQSVTLTIPAGADPEQVVRYSVGDGRGGVADARIFARLPHRGGYYEGVVSLGPGDIFALVGNVKITVSRFGEVTGSLTLSGERFPLTGRLDAEGKLNLSLAPLASYGSDPYLIALSLQWTEKKVTGAFSYSSNQPYTFTASRPAPPPLDVAGSYTVVVRQTSPMLPRGSGWALARVSPQGRVAYAGRLSDGTAVSVGSIIDANRRIPIYANPYRQHRSAAGEFAGVVSLFPGSDADGRGTLRWTQQERHTVEQPEMFSGEVDVLWSKYSPPSTGAGTSLLGAQSSGGLLHMSGGRLSEPLTVPVRGESLTFRSLSRDVPVLGCIARANGRVIARAAHPSKGGVVFLNGVVFQAAGIAEGYFLAPHLGKLHSGGFQLTQP